MIIKGPAIVGLTQFDEIIELYEEEQQKEIMEEEIIETEPIEEKQTEETIQEEVSEEVGEEEQINETQEKEIVEKIIETPIIENITQETENITQEIQQQEIEKTEEIEEQQNQTQETNQTIEEAIAIPIIENITQEIKEITNETKQITNQTQEITQNITQEQNQTIEQIPEQETQEEETQEEIIEQPTQEPEDIIEQPTQEPEDIIEQPIEQEYTIEIIGECLSDYEVVQQAKNCSKLGGEPKILPIGDNCKYVECRFKAKQKIIIEEPKQGEEQNITIIPISNATSINMTQFKPLDNITNITSQLNITQNITQITNITQNITIEETNVIITETTITPTIIRINEPVKWKKIVTVDNLADNINISLPKQTLNISIKKKDEFNDIIEIKENKAKVLDNDEIKEISEFTKDKQIQELQREIDLKKAYDIDTINLEKEINKLNKPQGESGLGVITGNVVSSIGSFFKDLFGFFGEDEQKQETIQGPKPMLSITGFGIIEEPVTEEPIEHITQETNQTIVEIVKEEEQTQDKEGTELIIQEEITENDELEIEYYTEAPIAVEKNITDNKKQIIISSETHYENILAYTTIPESPLSAVKVYKLNTTTDPITNITTSTKTLTELYSYSDTNNDSLIDYIEWIIPHLSNQTYEIEITILNVQSYPQVGGNWTVMFETSGVANLTIKASNETTWVDNYNKTLNQTFDLEFLTLTCNNTIQNYTWTNNNEIFVKDYNCTQTGYETSKVLTEGKHHLQFTFGDQIVYAHNSAGNPGIEFVNPTESDSATITNSFTEVNISITNAADLSEFTYEFNNSNYTFYNDSLVLMMNFDNLSVLGDSATQAVGVSLQGHNASFKGSLEPAWDCGNAVSGCALNLDGSDDYLTVSYDASLNLPKYTINIWVYTERFDGDILVHRGTASAYNYKISQWAGDWEFCVGSNDCVTTSYTGHQDRWVMLTMMYDGSNIIVYKDGIYKTQGAQTMVKDTGNMGIGDYLHSAGYEYQGIIDEVRILNRTMTADEVSQLYKSNLRKYDTDKYIFYANQTDLTKDITYSYQGTAIDTSANSNQTEVRTITYVDLYTNISLTLTPSTAATSSTVYASGNLNISNGTIMNYSTFYINSPTTTNISYHWFTSGAYLHNFRYPVIIESSTAQTNVPIHVTGQNILDGSGLHPNNLTVTFIEVIDPKVNLENQGELLSHTFTDINSDFEFDLTDFITFETNISAGEKRLIYIYDTS